MERVELIKNFIMAYQSLLGENAENINIHEITYCLKKVEQLNLTTEGEEENESLEKFKHVDDRSIKATTTLLEAWKNLQLSPEASSTPVGLKRKREPSLENPKVKKNLPIVNDVQKKVTVPEKSTSTTENNTVGKSSSSEMKKSNDETRGKDRKFEKSQNKNDEKKKGESVNKVNSSVVHQSLKKGVASKKSPSSVNPSNVTKEAKELVKSVNLLANLTEEEIDSTMGLSFAAALTVLDEFKVSKTKKKVNK